MCRVESKQKFTFEKSKQEKGNEIVERVFQTGNGNLIFGDSFKKL